MDPIVLSVVERYVRSSSSRLVLYHGTDVSHPLTLKKRSYLTTDFWIAASYGLDKTNQKECYVYEYIVEDPFETINPEEEYWGNRLPRLDSKYNVEMGHDSYQNNEPLKPSGRKWHLVRSEGLEGFKGWDTYEITPKAPQARHRFASTRVAVIRKEKGEYCVRSPNNPAWDGGCYPTKEKAEERLRQVEYFKHKSAACNFILRVALQKGISFDSLRSKSKAELKKLGLGLWDEEEGQATMLFPGDWYDEIPKGFEVVDIFGKTEKFDPRKSDDDQRFGFLPYGIAVKVAQRFLTNAQRNY